MKKLVTALCLIYAATAFASAGDAHAFDWMSFGRWTVLVICGMALAAPLVTGLRRLARLAVPALFAFLLLGLGIFATTPNGGVPTREEKERLRVELAAAEAERAALGSLLTGGTRSGDATNGPDAPTNLCFRSFTMSPSNVLYSISFSESEVPYGSRIELHEKTFALTNGFSPVAQHIVGVGETNVFGSIVRGTNAPPAAFYGAFADALSIAFPALESVVRASTGRRLSVATERERISVAVERSERPAKYPPYDPAFAADPFSPVPGIEYDATNATVTAESTGAFTLATGDELVVLDPRVTFGSPHDYAGETLTSSSAPLRSGNASYEATSPYPLDEPCLWEGWHSGTESSFGCTCAPSFSFGADLSAYPEITNAVSVVDDTAIAKVFLGEALVWSNSCVHARHRTFGGRSDFLSNDGCSSCSSCTTGSCDVFDGPSVGSVRFRVSLGSPSEGKVSGFLWFSRDDVFTPSPSSFSLLARRDASVTDTTSGGTRTVVCSDRGGLTLAVSPIEGGVKIVTTFTASGESNRTWRITREGGAMRFRKYSRGGNLMSDESYSRAGGEWTVIDNVSGLCETTASTGNVLSQVNEYSRVVETVASCGSVTGSHVRVTSEVVGTGDDAVLRETERRVRRADGGWSVSHASYWDSPGTRRHGQVRMAWGDDRAWSWADYDDLGRETFRLDQRGGSAAPEDYEFYSISSLSDSSAFATVTEYEPHAGDSCHTKDFERPRTVSRYAVENSASTLISRTWTVYARGTAPNGWPTVTETTIRAFRQDAQMADTNNAVSVVTRYDDESSAVPYLLRGEVLSETDEDGVATTNEFSISDGVVSRTSRRYYEARPFPTYSYDERDLDYGLTLFESTRLTDDTAVEFDWRRHSYDSRRRLVSTEYDDGSSETNDYDCCKLRFRIDRTGATTLRSAKTGQDRLYYAEEEVYLKGLLQSADYIYPESPYWGRSTFYVRRYRATQHFMDGFGRETNVVVRGCEGEGSMTNSSASINYGPVRERHTSYPGGTGDFVRVVDECGIVTDTVSAESPTGTVTIVEERDGETSAVARRTVSSSSRGGGSAVRVESDGKWRETREFEEYGDDGTRMAYTVRRASDAETVTNAVRRMDFLGRVVYSAGPASEVTNLYIGATGRIHTSVDLKSGVAVTNLYDETGELCGSESRGVVQTEATGYRQFSNDWWRVETSAVSSGSDTNSTVEAWTRLTGLSDAVRSQSRTVVDGAEVSSSVSSFDPQSLLMTTTDISATEGTSVTVSRFGRALTVTTPRGTTENHYDPFGNVFYVKRTGPDGSMVQDRLIGYDDFDRVVLDGRFWKKNNTYDVLRGYDARGNCVATTNELGEAVERTYDAEGRVLSESGDTYPLLFGYDSDGHRTSLSTTRDGVNWDMTHWHYDAATGSCTNKVYADGSAEAYSYTSDALPLRRTSPDGDWTENVYDENRRRVGQASSDPSCEYGLALDSFGRTVAASNSVARYAYALANGGVATNETASVGLESASVARSVDAYGRVVSLSREGVEDAVVYNPTNGTIATISNAEACVTYAYTSDLLDAGYSIELADGTVFNRVVRHWSTYLRERVSVTNSSPVAGNAFSYSYDTLNRPVARNSDAFAYNRCGEVTNAVVSGVSDAYAWDSIGNPTGVDVNCLNQIHRPAQYDPLSVYYTPYTQNGELAADWDVRYLYDAESRLVAVGTWLYDEERYLSGDYDDWMDLWTFDVAVSNRYDHLGRRVQKITPEATHMYFYDGWLLVKEVVERSGDTRRCGVSPRHCGGAGSSTSLGEDAAGSRVSMEDDVIEYHWGKDLSGTIGGAGGAGGLLYVKINGVIYVPWYDAYGNILGYWDEEGYAVAEYTYDAFGKLIASSGPMADVFSLRYSTKYFDAETGFYYYGYRFYSPELKRWITRDPIGEEGGVNLYAMCVNSPIDAFDILGTSDATVVIEGLGAGWAGARVTLNGKTAVRLNNELYYLTMTKPVGTRTPLSGSTTSLFLFKDGNPKKALRIDYHKFPLNSPDPPYWHVNVDGGGIAKVANSSKLNHTTSAKIRGTGRMLTVFKHGEKICFIAGFAMSAIDIYKAENRVRETTRQVVGWGAAYAGGRIGSALGAKAGMATAIALGQAGPQVATPEEVITVPVLGVIGGIGGGLVGGIGGFIFGSNVTGKVYDWAFTPLTKEEWEVGCESK